MGSSLSEPSFLEMNINRQSTEQPCTVTKHHYTRYKIVDSLYLEHARDQGIRWRYGEFEIDRKKGYSLNKGTDSLVRHREKFEIEGVRDRECQLYLGYCQSN